MGRKRVKRGAGAWSRKRSRRKVVVGAPAFGFSGRPQQAKATGRPRSSKRRQAKIPRAIRGRVDTDAHEPPGTNKMR